jgi:hypothetical protein
MSWGVAAQGKAPKVREEIARQFANGGKCMEPEETIRQSAAATIDAAIAGQHDEAFVKVSASGSMSFRDYSNRTDPTNSLSISIEPMHGLLV